MNFQKPRGTNDLYFESMDEFEYVTSVLRKMSNLYCFHQIETPIFEHLELFTKNIGESTDIVQKEIYTFLDKSDRKLALRPEGTAGVIRAYVENKIFGNKNTSTKFFYINKLFRYERPQNGRFREFHQFGIEYLGTNSFFDMVECIVFADSILKTFGLENQYVLKINNIGDFAVREKWIKALKEYFSKYKDQLSEDSIKRLEINPLRILDDKEDGKKEFVLNAPKINDFLTVEQKEEFKRLQINLSQLGIKFQIEETLVRGLDYYTNTVFEFVSNSDAIAKATIIGGGEYNKLIKETGGPDQKGIGFAIGLERLIFILKEQKLIKQIKEPSKYLIGVKNEINDIFGLAISCKLRNKGVQVNFLPGVYKPQKIVKYANDNNISSIVWLNENSFETQKIELENLSKNTKQELSVEDFIASAIERK